MASFKSWIHAFRLRTLPLALSSITVGCALAYSMQSFNIWIAVLAVVTTIFLQVLSNLANDYGDSVIGTDNSDRVGPQRTVQSGSITKVKMLRAIIICSLLSLISGLGLLYISFQGILNLQLALFVFLGMASIGAAINYTVGKNPYGYKGFGDLFVLIFFGFIGVAGSYFLFTLSFHWDVLLMALSMGCFSMAVLNLNNMRDIENDRNSGKFTLVVKMGLEKAKRYHLSLIGLAFLSSIAFIILNLENYFQFLFLLVLPLFILDLKNLWTLTNAELDPFLKKTAIKTLFFAILFTIGLII